jgi:hypothetical protein
MSTVGQQTLPGGAQAAKYERLGFTFCKLGTAGLIAWLLTPQVMVLVVAAITITLYTRAFLYGLTKSRCVLRTPLLIIGFWSVVALADAAWLISTGLPKFVGSG